MGIIVLLILLVSMVLVVIGAPPPLLVGGDAAAQMMRGMAGDRQDSMSAGRWPWLPPPGVPGGTTRTHTAAAQGCIPFSGSKLAYWEAAAALSGVAAAVAAAVAVGSWHCVGFMLRACS